MVWVLGSMVKTISEMKELNLWLMRYNRRVFEKIEENDSEVPELGR